MESQLLDTIDIERERDGYHQIKRRPRRRRKSVPRCARPTLRLYLRGLKVFTAACEGAVLVVDAAQGVEKTSLKLSCHECPGYSAINKIDLPVCS